MRWMSNTTSTCQCWPLPAPARVSPTQSPPATTTLRYFYDEGPNSVGRLSQVELPYGQTHFSYEARGLVASEERRFQLNTPTLDVTMRVEQSYNALGQLSEVVLGDGQRWQIGYDLRGLPTEVARIDSSGAVQRVASLYARRPDRHARAILVKHGATVTTEWGALPATRSLPAPGLSWPNQLWLHRLGRLGERLGRTNGVAQPVASATTRSIA